MNIAYYTQLSKPLRKLWFYARGFVNYALPGRFVQWRMRRFMRSLSTAERAAADERAAYYCRLPKQAALPESAIRVGDFRYPWHSEHKFVTYFFDLYRVVRSFPDEVRFVRLFGDVNREQEVPTFVKSRPIVAEGTTSMSTILKLNSVRHFRFISDSKPFAQKQDRIVFRNLVFADQPQRTSFLELFSSHPMADAGMVNANSNAGHPEWLRPYMSIDQQLEFKFIACIEGNDVATNLKWVMSSNSIAVMPKPCFETWFMEGTLRGDYHYIEVAPDYHDLEEKLLFYIQHPQAAEDIIRHAHEYVRTFINPRLERAAQLLTAYRYFEQTGQQSLLPSLFTTEA